MSTSLTVVATSMVLAHGTGNVSQASPYRVTLEFPLTAYDAPAPKGPTRMSVQLNADLGIITKVRPDPGASGSSGPISARFVSSFHILPTLQSFCSSAACIPVMRTTTWYLRVENLLRRNLDNLAPTMWLTWWEAWLKQMGKPSSLADSIPVARHSTSPRFMAAVTLGLRELGLDGMVQYPRTAALRLPFCNASPPHRLRYERANAGPDTEANKLS